MNETNREENDPYKRKRHIMWAIPLVLTVIGVALAVLGYTMVAFLMMALVNVMGMIILPPGMARTLNYRRNFINQNGRRPTKNEYPMSPLSMLAPYLIYIVILVCWLAVGFCL